MNDKCPVRIAASRAQEINAWMRNRWDLYASQMHNEKLLRLLVSGQGRYRVLYGDEILYEGFQVAKAVAAWEAV